MLQNLGLLIIEQTISGNDHLIGYPGLFLILALFSLAAIELYFLIFRKKGHQ